MWIFLSVKFTTPLLAWLARGLVGFNRQFLFDLSFANNNESKTEVCLFHKHDQPLITIKLQGQNVVSKKSMNVLVVIFNTKLTWSLHIAQAISKANKSLFAL